MDIEGRALLSRVDHDIPEVDEDFYASPAGLDEFNILQWHRLIPPLRLVSSTDKI